MARDLITAIKSTAMSTGSAVISSDLMVKASTANGAYIKTTGIDPTNLILVIRRTTASTETAKLYVRAGSTSGNEDYEPGLYSTGRDFVIEVPESTVAAQKPDFLIRLTETARFLDTNNYINLDFSTALSSGGGTTERVLVGALYLT